jgi:hypothetical protein
MREDLLLCSSYLPLGVPNWVVICLHQLASGVVSMYHKLYYPSVVSELLLDMYVNLNFPRLVMP